MYPSVRDARQYLNDSVIMFKRTPVRVLDAFLKEESIFLHLLTLDSQKELSVPLDTPELSFLPVPTGYGTDPEGNTFYLRRHPVRRYKQGLHRTNISFDRACPGVLRFPSQQADRSLSNMIKGIYQSLDKALEGGGPFHRHFQICNHVGRGKILQYKGANIGAIRKRSVDLFDKYFYMDRMVEEVFYAGS